MPAYDVVVVGHGIAGLSAGIRAAEANADTAILEKSPKDERGGHSRFAGATMRFPMEEPERLRDRLDMDNAPDRYPESDFRADLHRVTRDEVDPDLLDVFASEAVEAIEWLHDHGVAFQVHHQVGERDEVNPLKSEGRGERLQAVGEGEAVVEALADAAEEAGVDLHYEREVRELRSDDGTIVGVETATPNGPVEYDAGAVILAAGSYVSNPEKRTRYFGRRGDQLTVRGSKHNRGEALDAALDAGARADGQWGGAHIVLLDANAPDIEGGRTRINGYQYGLILNENGDRFVDEGEDVLAKTYAKFGERAYEQPGQCAFVVYDSSVAEYVNSQMDSEPLEFDSLDALLSGVDLDGLQFRDVDNARETIQEYNESVQPGTFDPTELDGKHTAGLTPPKSNWAVELDEPPFYCYPVEPGITFAFGGVSISTEAEVIDSMGNTIDGLWAAGNSTSGIFYHNYAAGSAQTRGAVFGRIAGRNAADSLA
jgi:tricarballylate dehydrogenase